MRLILDTDIVVAGLRSDKGIARQLLVAALERRIVILLSVPLMLEYEAVTTRPDHLRAMGITALEVNQILDALAAVCERVELHFLWRPKLRDPGDEMVLETAINARADCLITFNTRHLKAAAGEFGVRVCTPGEFWRGLGG